MTNSKGPVRHIVLCRFRNEVVASSRLAFFEQIRRLAEIPSIAFTNFQCGPNVSPEGYGMDFGDGFMMDFESRDACFAYLAHPTHRAIGARLIEALEGGVQGLLVFDITLDNHEKSEGKTRPVLHKHRDARSSRAAQPHD
ncbi:Dabb family protein [Caballeronia zhejiangensis]|uniref:Dabb family protein n=1 Tax=Caballeronia zhejiangensis TaxID=871203 RepID=UPI00158B7C65|nr:Dabb family protein [Caballeronia zhejiangensis]